MAADNKHKVLVVTPFPPPMGGIASWSENLKSYRGVEADRLAFVNSAVTLRKIGERSATKRVVFAAVEAALLFSKVLHGSIKTRAAIIHYCSACELGLIRDIALLIAVRALGRVAVLHVHRGKQPDVPELLNGRNGFEAVMFRWACHAASKVVVLNQPAYNAVTSVKRAEAVALVPNFVHAPPVTSDRLTQAESGPTKFIFVGYVIERKGIFDLLRSFLDISSRGGAFELRVVGPIEDATRDKLQKMFGGPSPEWLEFCGPMGRSEISDALLNSDYLVLPSYAEGLPMVVLEAMSCGVPVIASSVGGIPEAVIGGGGACFEAGDLAALAELLSAAIGETMQQRLERRALALKKVQLTYSADVVVPSLFSFWDESDA